MSNNQRTTLGLRYTPEADQKMQVFVERLMYGEKGEVIRDKQTGRIYEILLIAKFIDPTVEVAICKDYLDIWAIPLSDIQNPSLFQRNI